MANREEEREEEAAEDAVGTVEEAQEEAEAAAEEVVEALDNDDTDAALAWAEELESRLAALEVAEARIAALESDNAALRAEMAGHHHSDEREEVAPPEKDEVRPIRPHPYSRLPRFI